jgi:hypothetical protein
VEVVRVLLVGVTVPTLGVVAAAAVAVELAGGLPPESLIGLHLLPLVLLTSPGVTGATAETLRRVILAAVEEVPVVVVDS